ncbi:TetR family transcriptional regulator [Mycobacterium sp. NAZ190054]|uniref:TetR family transcriptional regulator n=1 Tax=Mycobacterium sp. NAZ190054 TaxID=1747766 RepID=UPI00079AD930|nr:TetR family transcriptional regulator [Mycobacterium sp. NAZ190054]KWX68753.1 hypothetical protein ASJ79_16320 [Mycobacterium sp. NAZ190054]
MMQRTPIRAPEAQRRRLEKILASGTTLFDKKGFGRTSMDDIAEAAGITKRTLYRYVSSKQDFLLMIHEQFLDAAESLLDKGGDNASATARLESFVRAYVTVIVRHQRAVRVFFDESNQLTPEAKKSVVDRRDGFERRLREILTAGIESGEFDARIDVDVISAGIFGALASVYQWYTAAGSLPTAKLTDLLAQLVLAGLRNTDGDEHRHAAVQFPALEFDHGEAATVGGSTPQHALEAAVTLFAHRGYAETSTQEIADAAGMTKSALFYHIGSKEDLLYAIQFQFAVRTLALLEEWRTHAQEPVDALRTVIVNHARVMGEQQTWVRVFTEQLRYLPSDRRKQIAALRGRYVDGIAEIIEAGVAQGCLRDTGQPRVVALVIVGMLNWMARWFHPDGRLDAADVGRQFAQFALGGVAPSARVTA